MPGVPTGRACDGCRKQKKKCDEKQPACSRCIRLKITCVGSGQQRFKFQQDKRFAFAVSSRPQVQKMDSDSPEAISNASEFVSIVAMPTKPEPMHIRLPPDSPTATLTNDLSSLANRFIKTINPSTDLRYNLWWTFGAYLEDIPRRLGTNEALDRSIEALTTAHAGFCSVHRQGATVEALASYAQALKTLRIYLDDRVHARSSNTLCAVMVLLICQLFLGQTTQCWSGHAEGAAQILQARKQCKPRDLFEKKLFLSLRGSVLFEGLFNDRINLTQAEWDDLVTSEFDQNTPEGRILGCLARGPDLMRRGRQILQTGTDATLIRAEILTLYQICQVNLLELKARAIENDVSSVDMTSFSKRAEKAVRDFFYAHYQRTYGVGLVVTLFFNCMLGALVTNAYDGDSVSADATELAEEVLALAERSAIYRPVGAAYLLICLAAAWAATSDPVLKAKVRVALNDYRGDFRMRDPTYLSQELEWTAEHLRLGIPFRINGESYYSGL
ncbi:transcriptional regulator family: Fungal Specific TF [Penicillium longicatenatum]|uniref:transcriptional regulator family: Fungal Specific TF n=1 Tax=Penicillium longicatenatum TaxID=1561947 RepID=UPI00254669A7|nr:transcriptional regulator family: Fungal Specific TF [Penicillium longicatenatum]KAJ5650673.1 transcriptional regulator family: Fungal Specific TF [Penicillium longicatenatum]